jgi:hypothetical protein
MGRGLPDPVRTRLGQVRFIVDEIQDTRSRSDGPPTWQIGGPRGPINHGVPQLWIVKVNLLGIFCMLHTVPRFTIWMNHFCCVNIRKVLELFMTYATNIALMLHTCPFNVLDELGTNV